MKFSVIVPVYNVEKYVGKCLQSIIKQTYSDYEVIIVNDGSTDNSYVIAQEYAMQYKDKIKLITQENKGLGGARNTGIEHAKGEYLVFVDSDDYIDEHYLEIILENIEQYNSDIIMFNYAEVNIHGEILKEYKYKHYASNIRLEEDKELLFETPSACNKVFKKELFSEISFPEKIVYEDFAIYPMLLYFAKKITIINNCLYYYVQRDGSIMHKKNTSRYNDIMVGFKNIISFYKEKDIFIAYLEELKLLAVLHVAVRRILPLIHENYKNPQIKEMTSFLNQTLEGWHDNIYMDRYPYLQKSMKRIAEGKWLYLFLKNKIQLVIENK